MRDNNRIANIFYFLLLSSSICLANNENILLIKIGTEIVGIQKITYLNLKPHVSIDEDVSTGFSLAIEFQQKNSSILRTGLGAIFQIPRSLDVTQNPKFNFISPYGLILLRIMDINEITSNIVLQFGYNIFLGDEEYTEEVKLSGGINWGAGLNIIYKDLIVIEGLYRWNTGLVLLKESSTHKVFEVIYPYLYLSIGVVIHI